jgi:hypothetical protein
MKHIGKPHTQTIICLLVVDIVFFSLTDPLRVPRDILVLMPLAVLANLYFSYGKSTRETS